MRRRCAVRKSAGFSALVVPTLTEAHPSPSPPYAPAVTAKFEGGTIVVDLPLKQVHAAASEAAAGTDQAAEAPAEAAAAPPAVAKRAVPVTGSSERAMLGAEGDKSQ